MKIKALNQYLMKRKGGLLEHWLLSARLTPHRSLAALTWNPAASHPEARRCSDTWGNPPSYSALNSRGAYSGRWCWWSLKGCESQSHGCQTPARPSRGCSLKDRQRQLEGTLQATAHVPPQYHQVFLTDVQWGTRGPSCEILGNAGRVKLEGPLEVA